MIKFCSNLVASPILQTAISALQSVLQEDFKATEIEVYLSLFQFTTPKQCKI